MTHELKKYEAIIVSLTARWAPRLPPCSIYDWDDLISEGWLIYNKIKNVDIKVKRTTY